MPLNGRLDRWKSGGGQWGRFRGGEKGVSGPFKREIFPMIVGSGGSHEGKRGNTGTNRRWQRGRRKGHLREDVPFTRDRKKERLPRWSWGKGR